MRNSQIEELRKRYNDNVISYDEIGLLFRCIDTLDKVLDQEIEKNKSLELKMQCENYANDRLKEFIDIINTLYLQGYIKDNDGKVVKILHSVLNSYIDNNNKNVELINKIVELKDRNDFLRCYINSNCPFKVGSNKEIEKNKTLEAKQIWRIERYKKNYKNIKTK